LFRKIFSVLFTILIIASILTGNFSCFVKAEHGKWIVDDDGVADFQSIQDAVDVACEGDIIFVKRGLYRESLRIYKSLSLIGEDMETTIVEANVTKFEYGVTITASNVSFTGFTIRNAAIAIAIWGGYGMRARNNVGLQFFYSNSNVIYHNNFLLFATSNSSLIRILTFSSIIDHDSLFNLAYKWVFSLFKVFLPYEFEGYKFSVF
jgi:hypothetical protein